MQLSLLVEQQLLKIREEQITGTEFDNVVMHENNLMICLDPIKIVL